MAKTDMIRKKAAKEFTTKWSGKGYEKGESQLFWIELLQNVYNVENIGDFIRFEDKVHLDHTSFIDAYIPSTHVMIEQKSFGKDLLKPIKQSNGSFLTPFQQAKRYVTELPLSQHPRWIVTCNFNEFLIYDMENPQDEPQQLLLENLPKDFHRLQFLVDSQNTSISPETRISLDAGNLVGELYDSLRKQYLNPDEESVSRNLNILCVRIIFCLYAEDAGLFDTKTAFEDYIKLFNPHLLRDGIKKLFKALNTKREDRDKYDSELVEPFPYVNGGLFAEDIEIPNFTEEIVNVIVEKCATFDWSEISPTIFGAVFESTLNPETRRNGGMHYTSIENIHKVIDPLFLDDLKSEFEEICKQSKKARSEALAKFQKKLGSLKFLDPACGCGNFLTETYLSLRRLENKVISVALNDTKDSISKAIPFDELISVKISQFYGIEINDFAVDVAKTSIWIAENQMIKETEEIVPYEFKFLPLSTSATIVEGNALRINWATLKNEEAPTVYDYIIGNPPFVGYKEKVDTQKMDLKFACKIKNGDCIKNTDSLDYVCGWYYKAAQLMVNNNNLKATFVSTNSITQGEQVALMWKPLFDNYHVSIDFAYKSFVWSSETKNNAKVHCVIIAFSNDRSDKQCRIYNGQIFEKCSYINPYLYNRPNIWITSRRKPICDSKKVTLGVHIFDNHHFIFTEREKNEFVKNEPASAKYFKRWVSADDFLYGKCRYYLDLKDCPPNELKAMPYCYERVKLVMEYRKNNSYSKNTPLEYDPYKTKQGWKADCPYIIIPNTSGQNRTYLPIDFKNADTVVTMPDLAMPNGDLYDFGVISSSVHMAWLRIVCGRLKGDYRYAHGLVYNNFPWPEPTEKQKRKIENTAKQIIETRAKYPDSSLADLYDEISMPEDLRKAHIENDKAVMAAYGFKSNISEAEIVAELFKMYEKLTK